MAPSHFFHYQMKFRRLNLKTLVEHVPTSANLRILGSNSRSFSQNNQTSQNESDSCEGLILKIWQEQFLRGQAKAPTSPDREQLESFANQDNYFIRFTAEHQTNCEG